MRILLFAINYAPEPTGSGPYTTAVADHYAEQGHIVHVITGVPHYPWWRAQRRLIDISAANPAVRRYRHYVPTRPALTSRALFEASWLASASRSLPVESADVVVGVITNISAGILAWIASTMYRTPLGLIFQDLLGPAANETGANGKPRVASLVGGIEGFLARRASGVAVVSDGFRPYLEATGVPPERIHRVRNWTRWASHTASRSDTRRRLGWSESEFICLHAGNMGQKQGLENVINAATYLTNTEISVVLAGEGNDRGRLQRLAQVHNASNIKFVGLQPPGNFESMLEAADVLLLNQRPSLRETALPSKLAAYFRAGRPVVAAVAADSNAGLELKAARGGILVEPGEPRALARVIMSLLSRPDLRRTLGANGRKYADAFLSRSAALTGYDEFLVRLVAESTRGFDWRAN